MRQLAEPPEAIRLDRQLAVVALQRVIEVDHAFDETWREYPDAAEIEQIYGAVRRYGVVAEMRVAVDHAVIVERHVPGPEHAQRDLVAQFDGRVFGEFEDRAPFEPGHRQQTPG